ncbi:SSI family serine proteinase inhibitor [Streptomyces sp. NBC_00344]|uniref:SSI family serine proteinase inhibitor n=1 Tax=Streptomyces sp. NBC_00344 TaxID=2975720 RepID=UPI002E1F75F8
MLRRIALTALVSLAALAALPGIASADGPQPAGQATDQLTVTVQDAGDRAADGTRRLECGASGATGTHRSPQEACDRLAALAADGKEPFEPVPSGMMCTMQYGGSATAHITGTWQGRPVDATFRRTNGCEIARWNNLEPLLPHAAL